MKTDYRKKLTRLMFKNAFVALLKEKPVRSITVRELCEKAEVNRGTFYSHYQDTYALLESVENELVEGLLRTLAPFGGVEEVGFYSALLGFFKENAEACAALAGENGDGAFAERLLAIGKEFFIRTKETEIKGNSRYAELWYEYASHGCKRILSLWIEGGAKEGVEETARLIERMVVFGK